jgi:hypothetical protein
VAFDESSIVRDLELTLDRFRGDPRAALRLAPGADAAAARAAFVELAKRYHPAKYARLSAPVVRLANETFLAIRRAYDAVATSTSATVRSTLPVRGDATPIPRSTTAARPAPVARAPEPAKLSPRPSAAAPSAAAAPSSAAAPPRAPSLNPRRDPLPPRDDRFDRAIEHLRERRWTDARPLLSALATEAPNDVRFRAYLHYLRGWEAHELGKDGEARAEWRRALACDPGLGMAQWALQKTGLG